MTNKTLYPMYITSLHNLATLTCGYTQFTQTGIPWLLSLTHLDKIRVKISMNSY